MTIRYAKHVSRKKTPQSEPIPGEKQTLNSAGGYVYEVDKWARLRRFLVLGSDGGTYYVSEKKHTRDNAGVVEACLAENAARTIREIVEVSDSGRAPKNDPAILALALAASVQNPDATGWSSEQIRRSALVDALPKVCRIPTHLFHFLTYIKALRRSSRMLRGALGNWYGRWSVDQFAYELVKYQARDGWANRDVLRLARPKLSVGHQAALRWVVGAPMTEQRTVVRLNRKGTDIIYPAPPEHTIPAIITAFEEAKTLDATKAADAKRLVSLIEQHKLSREMLPTAALNTVAVWDALLPHMKPEAMIRNLGKMSAVGLTKPLSVAENYITSILGNTEALRKARIHPLFVLNALRVYAKGKGDKGSLEWKVSQKVVDALDGAFYKTFRNVEPTGQKIMLALDVSGSMSAPIAGTGLSCREACAALALVTANVESNYVIVGFTQTGFRSKGRRQLWIGYENGISPLDISPKKRLDDVVKYLARLDFGGTDCALPMLYATHEKLDVDAFCVYTDSETWAGDVHPKQALAEYRSKQSKPQAKQVVVGMTATGFTIADPADPLTLDVVGFDTATPQAISAFIAGEIGAHAEA